MIVTACDSRYLAEAKYLLRSCARHAPDQRLYLFLVNDQTPDSIILGWNKNTIIERVVWDYEPTRWRALMCCARSIPVASVLQRYQEPTLYLDTDILVRRPLTDLWKQAEECDLMAAYRPHLQHVGAVGSVHASTFNNGVFLLQPTAVGITFAQQYNHNIRSFIASGKPLERHDEKTSITSVIDQEYLYLTYEEMKAELTFCPLPPAFNDARFSLESPIWHGKGKARNNPLYKIEKARYQSDPAYYSLWPVFTLAATARTIKKKLS